MDEIFGTVGGLEAVPDLAEQFGLRSLLPSPSQLDKTRAWGRTGVRQRVSGTARAGSYLAELADLSAAASQSGAQSLRL